MLKLSHNQSLIMYQVLQALASRIVTYNIRNLQTLNVLENQLKVKIQKT